MLFYLHWSNRYLRNYSTTNNQRATQKAILAPIIKPLPTKLFWKNNQPATHEVTLEQIKNQNHYPLSHSSPIINLLRRRLSYRIKKSGTHEYILVPTTNRLHTKTFWLKSLNGYPRGYSRTYNQPATPRGFNNHQATHETDIKLILIPLPQDSFWCQ